MERDENGDYVFIGNDTFFGSRVKNETIASRNLKEQKCSFVQSNERRNDRYGFPK